MGYEIRPYNLTYYETSGENFDGIYYYICDERGKNFDYKNPTEQGMTLLLFDKNNRNKEYSYSDFRNKI
jgi:hypothetical protein